MPKIAVAENAASRRAFVRQFGPMTVDTGYGYDIADYHDTQLDRWRAWRAGAAWQRRQKGKP